MSLSFYHELEAFEVFEELVEDAHYQSVPEDWSLVVTDVVGSTKAISAGRYRDVNTVGAASIVVAKNAINRVDFPFVFGGDGALMLLPPEHFSAVLEQLMALRQLASEQFGLGLRVGAVPVAQLHAAGHDVKLGKYQVTKELCFAVFQGSGFTAAEDWVKNRSAEYACTETPGSKSNANLGGLSCRWQAVRAKRGRIVSLIALSRNQRKDTLDRLLATLREVFPEGIDKHNPIDWGHMAYKTVGECYRDEKRYHASSFCGPFFLRFMEILIAVWAFRYWKPVFFFSPRAYAQSLSSHNDFRKFDGTLRMTLDCHPDQVEAVRRALDEFSADGEIHYGLHGSDTALMTCFVDGLGQGQHFHFVDAEAGGYAAAAVELKRKISSSAF
ncbi:MAG: DUF3095 family protein [Opitutales bacterium]|nr:DUF3095 family protein [Opitutales bacterium]